MPNPLHNLKTNVHTVVSHLLLSRDCICNYKAFEGDDDDDDDDVDYDDDDDDAYDDDDGEDDGDDDDG